MELIASVYRYRVAAVGLMAADGTLLAGLPMATVASALTGTRTVSVPFSDHCAPIAPDTEHLHALARAIDAELARSGYSLEVHAAFPALSGSGPGDRFLHHVVPLEGGHDAVLARIRPAKRRAAAQARARGVTVLARHDRAALRAFFALHVLTRRRLGVPTQPRRFFDALAGLCEDGLGTVLLAGWGGRWIAANVYLHHGDVLTYKYGASDPAHLDKRPNDLLHHEGLALACELGCRSLDLGRTEPDNDGLARFKRQFGALETELLYTRAPAAAASASVRTVSGLQRSLIRRAPPAFGRLLGAAAYRHFG